MSYLLGVGGVVILQMGFTYAIILASTGNGSFVGLGAMLFAVLGIPLIAQLHDSSSGVVAKRQP